MRRSQKARQTEAGHEHGCTGILTCGNRVTGVETIRSEYRERRLSVRLLVSLSLCDARFDGFQMDGASSVVRSSYRERNANLPHRTPSAGFDPAWLRSRPKVTHAPCPVVRHVQELAHGGGAARADAPSS